MSEGQVTEESFIPIFANHNLYRMVTEGADN